MTPRSKKRERGRGATVAEIDSRLRNAGDYLGAMIKHEALASDAAREAARTKNFASQAEAARCFNREFQSFLNAARTVRNYLVQAATASECRQWVDERLKGCIFEFHVALAAQDMHDRDVLLGVRQTVRYTADTNTPMVETPVGVIPAKMTVTELGEMAYQYNPNNLEPRVAAIYKRVAREYGNCTVVELAGRFFDGLSQILKNAQRRGRFQIPTG